MRHFGEENIAQKITFIPTDVSICFICKIFVAIIYTLVGDNCLFISLNSFIFFRLKLFWFSNDLY